MGKLLDKIRGLRKPSRSFCAAVVVAAGRSERMGKEKLLLPLAGQAVLARTLLAVEQAERIDEIILVTREDLMLPFAELCKQIGLKKPVKIIKGGDVRTKSVLAGALETDPRTELIAVHDAARPLITPELIDAVVESAELTGASAPAIPVTDTVKVADESGIVRSTPDRTTLFAVQTPQVFRAEILRAALQSAVTCGANVTDDCAAVERLGKQVQLVTGDGENIRITRPVDLAGAEAILKEREERA